MRARPHALREARSGGIPAHRCHYASSSRAKPRAAARAATRASGETTSTRRSVGRLTSVRPAAANMPSVPTWELLHDHVLRDHGVGLDGPCAGLARELHGGAGERPADAALPEAHTGEDARDRPDRLVRLVLRPPFPGGRGCCARGRCRRGAARSRTSRRAAIPSRGRHERPRRLPRRRAPRAAGGLPLVSAEERAHRLRMQTECRRPAAVPRRRSPAWDEAFAAGAADDARATIARALRARLRRITMENRPDDPRGGDDKVPPAEHVGSFAEGEETRPHDEHAGSFAEGGVASPGRARRLVRRHRRGELLTHRVGWMGSISAPPSTSASTATRSCAPVVHALLEELARPFEPEAEQEHRLLVLHVATTVRSGSLVLTHRPGVGEPVDSFGSGDPGWRRTCRASSISSRSTRSPATIRRSTAPSSRSCSTTPSGSACPWPPSCSRIATRRDAGAHHRAQRLGAPPPAGPPGGGVRGRRHVPPGEGHEGSSRARRFACGPSPSARGQQTALPRWRPGLAR